MWLSASTLCMKVVVVTVGLESCTVERRKSDSVVDLNCDGGISLGEPEQVERN